MRNKTKNNFFPLREEQNLLCLCPCFLTSILFSSIFPIFSLFPFLPLSSTQNIAGKEPWHIIGRRFHASKSLVEWFRPGRSPACLQLSRWLSDTGPSFPCVPPMLPFFCRRLLQSSGLCVSTFSCH